MKSFSVLALGLSVFGATAAFACPGDKYEVHQIALDANGLLTRHEMKQVPAPDFDESQKMVYANVVTDKITLEAGDEIKLNAAPGVMDLTVFVTVKRTAQKADQDGIFSTTYSVRETMTSGWGGGTTEKNSLVTIQSNYLGNGKTSHDCGKVIVKELPNSTAPVSSKL